MFIEILIALLLGLIAGTFTGLTPGLHINLISATIVSLSALALEIVSPLQIIVFILSMSVTHTILDSIPSIYLGAPDADTVLTALPGHQLLNEGKGHIAVLLTISGGIAGLLFSMMAMPLITFILEPFAEVISTYIAYILIALLFFLLIREKNRFVSLLFFLTSGVVGFFLFDLPLKQPLLALLSGLFGVSLLLISVTESQAMPPQKTEKSIAFEKPFFATTIATIVGFFAAFLPGFGASQAAIYASMFFKNASKELFLFLNGAINTIAMIISLATFTILAKARNGSIVAMSNFVTIITQELFLLLCFVMAISGLLAAILGIRISRWFLLLMQKVSYRVIVYVIVTFLCILVFLFDSYLGLWVLVLTTLLGISAQKIGVSKHYLLGCLLLPTILYLI